MTLVIGLAALVACSSEHDPTDFGRRGTTTTSTTATTDVDPTGTGPVSATSTGPTSTTVAGSAPTTTAAATTSTSLGGPGAIRGTAVAGTAGGVEPVGGPFTQTDPFAEVVRLADGTCTGWPDGRAAPRPGSSPAPRLPCSTRRRAPQLGAGTITASRWEDPSGGGNQWTCFFDFTADLTAVPAEVLVKVGDLQPWTARPDAANGGLLVASVSTDAAIGQIASCPALPTPTTTAAPGASTVAATTVAPTTAPAAAPATGWNAVGQYWSVGIDSLCRAGLPVTALARPCRAPNQGSEYITKVVESDRPEVSYPNGAAIPVGTQLTVAVATGRPCG